METRQQNSAKLCTTYQEAVNHCNIMTKTPHLFTTTLHQDKSQQRGLKETL